MHRRSSPELERALALQSDCPWSKPVMTIVMYIDFVNFHVPLGHTEDLALEVGVGSPISDPNTLVSKCISRLLGAGER